MDFGFQIDAPHAMALLNLAAVSHAPVTVLLKCLSKSSSEYHEKETT